MSTPAIVTRILRDSPVAYFRLNEPASATAAVDSSGHGVTATKAGNGVFGATGILPADPQTGLSSTYTPALAISSNAGLHFTSAGTIEVFMFVDGGTGHAAGEILIANGHDSEFRICYLANNGNIGAKLNTAGGVITVDGGTGPGFPWMHYVATFDGTNLKIYINGELAATAAAGPVVYNSTYESGVSGNVTDGTGHGTGLATAEHAAFYNAALDALTIRQHYATVAYNTINYPVLTPWAGNTDIARRYRDGGLMRVLHIGDSITVRLPSALQRSLKPGKWVGFMGGTDVSVPEGNWGIALDNYSPYTDPYSTFTLDAARTYTFTFNGSATPHAASVYPNEMLYSTLPTAKNWANTMYRGDWMFEAMGRNVQPFAQILVKKTATGDTATCYHALHVARDGVSTVMLKNPPTGHIDASGSGWASYSISLPLTLDPAETSYRTGPMVDFGVTPTSGKTITFAPWTRVSTGEIGFEYGNIAIGGTGAAQWAAADGIYSDDLLQATCTNFGVTDFWIMHGQNGDVNDTIAAYPALIARLRSFVPNCSITIISAYSTIDYGYASGPELRFKLSNFLRNMAQADGNMLFLDLHSMFGPHTVNYANAGYSNDFYDKYGEIDGTHPSNTGAARIAELLDMMLRGAAYAGDPILQELLSRIPGPVPQAADYTPARAAKLDNLDVAVSTRMPDPSLAPLAYPQYATAPTITP